MQREIKVRGQRIDNNEWVYGYYYKQIQRNSFVPEKPILWERHFIRLLEADGIFLAYEVKPETIGQFIGLYDSSGKEIYEKDIMGWESYELTKNKIRWVVVFSPERGFKTWSSSKNDEIVIGNIIDNPELLNE
jgi:hypothetical protein